MNKIADHPAAGRLLRVLGVDPRQYFLLLNLFSTLSYRQEFEIGNSQISMRIAVGMYALLNAFINLLVAFAGRPPIRSFVFFNLVFTTFIVVVILTMEAINTFLNPVDVSVLAHQPIRDKSYFAAKFTYLAYVVGQVVLPINAAPALFGLNLKDASRLHPVTYLVSAYLLGIFIALITCGLMGLAFRFVPVARVRNSILWLQIGFFTFLGAGPRLLAAIGSSGPSFNLRDSAALPLNWFTALATPGNGAMRMFLSVPAASSMIVCAALIAFGVQSLSKGYLSRVHSLLHSGPSRQRTPSGFLGTLVRMISGRPSGRGAFAFVHGMARTDWQFRRSAYPMLIQFLIFPLLGLARTGLGHSPFVPGAPTFAQVLPHIAGVVGLIISFMISYSNQHRAAWIFLTFPADAMRTFARGIFWAMWLPLTAPPLLAMPLFAWSWGIADALLFAGYCIAIGSFYLSLEMFLINGLPFASPPESMKGSMAAPLVIAALIGALILVGLQWLFIFQSRFVTAGAVLIFIGAAYVIGQTSLQYLETNVLHSLHLIRAGKTAMFKEIS